ncbi:MAG: flavodoxin family protein [Chloroflexi bacterium]|nr:flavodoxin family protein [Chloroflexota bacterium]
MIKNKFMIKVLGIVGSPRRRGNTETLLDRFLAGAESAGAEIEKIVVARLKIAGCIACDGCWDDEYCIIQDDFQAVDNKLITADVIALAAPLFFWNLPAQAKALIDRGQCQWARKFVIKTPLAPTPAGRVRRCGVFICAGGRVSTGFQWCATNGRGFFQCVRSGLLGGLVVREYGR